MIEDGFADDEAGSGDGAIVLDETRAVEDAFGVTGEIAEGVAGDAAEADDHAGVLDGVVGVIQHRADAADLRAQGLGHHLVEPVGVDDFKVVVEQAEDGVVGLLRREVVDRAVIEGSVEGNDADGFFDGDRFEIIERGGIVGAVVHDQDLVVRVRRFFEDAVDAALEKFQAVARGDEERDERRLGGQRIFDAPVIAGDGDEFHGLFEAGEVIGEGFVGGFDRIVLFAGE